MLTDTELLDALDIAGNYSIKWICRDSTTGRGMRLHQDPMIGIYDTPREAIMAYLKENQ